MDGAFAPAWTPRLTGAAPGVSLDGDLTLGEALALRGLSLRAPGGRWTALLGRSGGGKSSLLKAIAGVLSGGFSGVVAASDQAPLDGRVAFMAQKDLLVPWASALENAVLGARLRGERPDWTRARAALAAVGLGPRAAARPDTLSGGERQRAALARTLMEDRPVALLDEPFSALDALTKAELQALAWEKLAGRTVILVTHDPMEAVRLADALYILNGDGLHPVGLDTLGAAGPPLRDPGEPATQRAAAALLSRLRALG